MSKELTPEELEDIHIILHVISFNDIPTEEHRRLKRARKIVDQEEIE